MDTLSWSSTAQQARPSIGLERPSSTPRPY
ncbi:MAG: hypothetical protein QOH45_2300, partial [Pseudonocardiales bacterium]|nr:hypothetical protein [Pseudonocardiales bacterium]